MHRCTGRRFCAKRLPPLGQPHHHERRLMPRGHELAPAEVQRHILRFLRRRLQHHARLAARREQRLNLRLAQRVYSRTPSICPLNNFES